MKLLFHFLFFGLSLFCFSANLCAASQEANVFFAAQLFKQHKVVSPGITQTLFKAGFDGDLSLIYNACEEGIASQLEEEKGFVIPKAVSSTALAGVFKYKNTLHRYSSSLDEMPRDLFLSVAMHIAPKVRSLITCKAVLKKKEGARDFRVSAYTEATCLFSKRGESTVKKEKSLAQAVHVSAEKAFEFSSRNACADAVKRLVKIK